MARATSCPICRKALPLEGEVQFRPFCSQRCKRIDLAGWLDGSYRISRPLSETDLDGAEEMRSVPLARSDDDKSN